MRTCASFAFFRRIVDECASRHPGIQAGHGYVDAMALDLVRKAWAYDVLVTENRFGDILSDLGAALTGGKGMAPSADVGAGHAVFQPRHGSAPDIVGRRRGRTRKTRRTMMRAPLRLAIVGTGYFSRFHHDAWRRMIDEGRVTAVGVCGLDREAAAARAGELGTDAVFDDFVAMLDAVAPDLVDIVTPPHTHLDFVRAAVGRGIAVICQKPFTRSLDEAEQLLAIIRRHGGNVHVHENFRFQPWYRALRGLVADGVIGTPYQAAFRLRPGDGQGDAAYLDRQPYFQQMPRFLVHETAIHLVDTFRFLFGDINSVYADLRRLNPVIAGEDAGMVLFGFAHGFRGLFDGNRLADHAARNRRLTLGEMVIEGSAATLSLDGDGVIRKRDFGTDEWQVVDYPWQDIGYAGDCVYRTNRHVVDHLLDGSPSVNDAASYLVNLRIEAAIYRSSELHTRLCLAADGSMTSSPTP